MTGTEPIELNKLGVLMYRVSSIGAQNPELGPGVVFSMALLIVDPLLCRSLRTSRFDAFHRPEKLPAAWEYVRKAWGFK